MEEMKSKNLFNNFRRQMHAIYTSNPWAVNVFASRVMDVTKIEELRKVSKLSLGAYILSAVSKGLKGHPLLNSTFVKGGRIVNKETRIHCYDTVDAAVSVDKVVAGERYPFLYVIRDSDQKSVAELDEILRWLKVTPGDQVPKFVEYAKFVKLPAPVRKIFVERMTKDPHVMRDKIGTFNFTNIGGMGLDTAFANSPRTVIIPGAVKGIFRPDHNNQPILRQEFTLTVSFNHITTDGAPVAEFLNSVQTELDAIAAD